MLFPIVSPEGSVNIFPPNAIAAAGDTVTFTCTESGGPGNMFEWTNPPDNIIISNISTLTLEVESGEDSGTYRCEVFNLAGRESSTARLTGESQVQYLYCDLLWLQTMNLSC